MKNQHDIANAYNTIAAHFSETRKNHHWKEFDKFTKYLPPKAHILDLGCGNGRLINVLPKDITYNGLDISSELIKEAKHLFPDHNFQEGTMTNLPYQNNSFDAVFAIASLQHLSSTTERRRTLQEMHRVLKPNGILFLSNWDIKYSPHKKTITKKYTDLFLSMGTLRFSDFIIPWKDQTGVVRTKRYYHHFSDKELGSLLHKSHFTIIKKFISNISKKNRNRCFIARKTA